MSVNNTTISQPQKNYKKAPFSAVHRKVYLEIVLGQITCGFGLGISGIAMNRASQFITIDNFWTGLIGAASLLGLFGSLWMGRLGDKIGRKRLLLINMYLFTLLSCLHLFVQSWPGVFVLRLLLGLMMAIDYTVGNALLVEWLPDGEGSKRQGNLLIYWTLGFIASYLVGTYFPNVGKNTWQYLLAFPGILSLVTALTRSFLHIPASPTWLASQGKVKTAHKVIRRHLGKKWGLPKKLRKVKNPNDVGYTTLFSKKYLRNTIVGGVFYATQSFSFFGISIFLPILMTSMKITNGTVSGIIYYGGMVIGVILGNLVFNRMDRRPFLISTFLSATLLIMALAALPNASSLIKLTLFTLFAIILSMQLILDYPYTSELFDVKIRATGVGNSIAVSRIGAAGGTFLLPILTNIGGASLAMWVCGIVLLIGLLTCLFLAPETNPKNLK